MKPPKQRRSRGIILAAQGWKKLQEARHQVEAQENFGDRYTLEELSDRTKLDLSTVARVLERESGVDKRTLERFFFAFGLELNKEDYFKPKPTAGNLEESTSAPKATPSGKIQKTFVHQLEAVEPGAFY